MSHPQELLDYWSALNDDLSSLDSSHTVTLFEKHLAQLTPLSEAGNFDAKYAIATIYFLELIYVDNAERELRASNDKIIMSDLLVDCARHGMTFAFDNLVTSGVGEYAALAREAAKEYEQTTAPDWDEDVDAPIYTPDWMSGAMELWMSRLTT